MRLLPRLGQPPNRSLNGGVSMAVVRLTSSPSSFWALELQRSSAVPVSLHETVASRRADSKTRVKAAGGIQHAHQVPIEAPAGGARAETFEPTGIQGLDHGEGRLRDPFVFAFQMRGYVCGGSLATQGAGSGCSTVGEARSQGCIHGVDKFSIFQESTFQKLPLGQRKEWTRTAGLLAARPITEAAGPRK